MPKNPQSLKNSVVEKVLARSDSKAAFVRSAGVGFPSGVIGITSMLLQ